VIEEW